MLSPPHRENLLDTNYNVAGFGVFRSGGRLYVVEDFGHSLPAYTPEQTREFDRGSYQSRAAGSAFAGPDAGYGRGFATGGLHDGAGRPAGHALDARAGTALFDGELYEHAS